MEINEMIVWFDIKLQLQVEKKERNVEIRGFVTWDEALLEQWGKDSLI